MQLAIENSIIHQFYSHDDQIGLRLAPEPLSDDEQLHELLEELTTVYTSKPAKGYASFLTEADEAEEVSDFPVLLKQWQAQELEFVELPWSKFVYKIRANNDGQFEQFAVEDMINILTKNYEVLTIEEFLKYVLEYDSVVCMHAYCHMHTD